MFPYISGSSAFQSPLTEDEEKQYLQEYAHGSISAKNILIERNMRLVAHIAKKYSNFNKDNEDLISIGTIGLIKGILSFKMDKKIRLATYTARCIENEILMSYRSHKKHSNILYLQEPQGTDKDGNEVCIADKLHDEDICTETIVETQIQISQMLLKMNKVLSKDESMILQYRYGIGQSELSQREIAVMMNISRSYVSRIEKRALGKLKNALS